MLACLTGCAYLGSYPTPEATKEAERLENLLRFGDGKIQTAAHAITKRLYAAFPDLGRNVTAFRHLLKTGPVKVSKEDLKTMSLFGYLTRMFEEDTSRTIGDCIAVLERVGL